MHRRYYIFNEPMKKFAEEQKRLQDEGKDSVYAKDKNNTQKVRVEGSPCTSAKGQRQGMMCVAAIIIAPR